MISQVTGGGALTRKNIDVINSNFASVGQPDFWCRPQNTKPGTADGSYDNPFATVGAALASPLLRPGMVIGLLGVTREELVGPLGVNDITIRGMATQPRQATTTTPLCLVKGQGWRFENIYFNNSATAAACVMLTMSGTGDPPADPSPEHTSFYNCYFTGAIYGIRASGGPNFVTIDSCFFFGFGDSGDTAISLITGAGVHTNYGWVIKNCEFWGNSRHIQGALSGASIHDNHFSYVNNLVTTAIFYDATGGANNAVYRNAFDVDSGNGGIATMFVLGTNDRFSANSLSTAVTTTAFSWGDPA
jgi:hypothetical protein